MTAGCSNNLYLSKRLQNIHKHHLIWLPQGERTGIIIHMIQMRQLLFRYHKAKRFPVSLSTFLPSGHVLNIYFFNLKYLTTGRREVMLWTVVREEAYKVWTQFSAVVCILEPRFLKAAPLRWYSDLQDPSTLWLDCFSRWNFRQFSPPLKESFAKL